MSYSDIIYCGPAFRIRDADAVDDADEDEDDDDDDDDEVEAEDGEEAPRDGGGVPLPCCNEERCEKVTALTVVTLKGDIRIHSAAKIRVKAENSLSQPKPP